jgi:hypothetical protein
MCVKACTWVYELFIYEEHIAYWVRVVATVVATVAVAAKWAVEPEGRNKEKRLGSGCSRETKKKD